VFALEYLNTGFLGLAVFLLVGAVELDEVFEAFAFRALDAVWLFPLVSAIALRFGGILFSIRVTV